MNNPSTFRIIMKRFLACFGCAAVLAASVSCTKDTTVAPEVKQGAMKSPLRQKVPVLRWKVLMYGGRRTMRSVFSPGRSS